MEWKILKEERVPRFLPLPVLLIGGGGRRDVMFEFFYKSILFVCWFLLFWKKFIEREKDLKLFVRVRIYIYIF